MAEVGLVASVFGIASLAASVSKGLFDLGYTMRHAREQIEDIAGEVTTFTAIIRQLGAVLKTQKGSFTDEAEKMVESCMKDCKRLCKTIRRQIKRKKESLGAARWLFRKKRAEELKRRMDSLRSVLGLMIQVVQLGRKLESKTTVPDALSEIREEMKLLKIEVLTYHRSLPKLQKAERCLEVSTRPIWSNRARDYYGDRPRPGAFGNVNKSPVYRARNPTPAEFSPFNEPHPQQQQYREGFGGRQGDASRPGFPLLDNEYGSAESDVSSYASATTPFQKPGEKPSSAMHPPSSNDEAVERPGPPRPPPRNGEALHVPARLTYRASQRLITFMPYNPTAPLRPPAGPARLIASTTQVHTATGLKPASPDDEATTALKLLFTKWTNVNPQLVEDVLDEDAPSSRPTPKSPQTPSVDSELESDTSRGRRAMYYSDSDLSTVASRSRSRHRPYPQRMPHDNVQYPQYSHIPPRVSPEPTGWGRPAFLHMGERRLTSVREAWRPPQFDEPPLAKVLANNNARFVWMLRSPEELSYWVDSEACVRYRMTPTHVYTLSGPSETILPKQWVRKEVVELFGFICKEDQEAYWAIDKALTYVEVRQLVEVSSHLIEKDIRKTAHNNLRKRKETIPSETPRKHAPQNESPRYTFPQPDSALSESAGSLVTISRPTDMELTRVRPLTPKHATATDFHTEQESQRNNDAEHRDEEGERMSIMSNHVSYHSRRTPSLSEPSNRGGESSGNLPRPALEREGEAGTQGRRSYDRDTGNDPRGSRSKREERRRARQSENDIQSQALDTRSRRRHRDRKYT